MTRRWLPEYVTAYRDRHGKERYRFRRKGFATHHFRTLPGTDGFAAELRSCMDGAPVRPSPVTLLTPGSIDELVQRYYATPRWRSMAASSQATYRNIIERFRAAHGAKPVALIRTAHLDAILGKMADRPAAANNLRKVMNRLFGYAVKIGMRPDNPAALTDAFKTSAGGFHTWSEDEIAAFRARHALGSRARLAMELLLNTAARRCNVVRIGPGDLRAGKIHVAHVKGGEATAVRLLPETRAAIDALPVAGIGTFLVTEFGKPFTPAGFGNWFRDRCNEAGLPQCSAHGLRKAMSRRLAEAGATDAQGRAVTGQKKNQTFAYYAASADREALAEVAVANLQNKVRHRGGENQG